MPILKPLILSSLLFPLSLLANTPQLSAQENLMSNYLAERKNEQLLFLEKLVNINSGTQNIEGVKKIGEILQAEFEALGFKTRWAELPAGMQRAPTLIAERKGSAGKKLLLIAHLDTVFQKDSPFQKFEQKGNIATGPGVIDNKGGLVVILYALKALQAAHALDDASIAVALTGDEENNGKPTSISRQPLIELAKQSDIALDFEPTIRNHASVGRRGTAHWLIEAKGNEGHSSIIFSKEAGDGAIFETARILNQMREKLGGEDGLTFNPGIIVGGTKTDYDKISGRGNSFGRTNLIPQTALVNGDIRYLTAAQKDLAKKKMEAIVGSNLPGTSATFQLDEVLPPMPATEKSLDLFKRYSQISQKLGYGEMQLLPANLRGGGDISYIAPYVSTSLVGIGAHGSGEHSPQEHVEIDSLLMQSQRAALLMQELVQPRGKID
ncbi:M20/M25/M40 family metallo-hydrolase [Collimonas humicola]|uniref:M20/M25/M40 family metallo-hydrolase n=1 Tax=Collimonas humicola TaxID=2825886 RepID=UPI001B8BE76C|nr:M20/M25/M40 family metallo-hydrolase [Collimonas humicola]